MVICRLVHVTGSAGSIKYNQGKLITSHKEKSFVLNTSSSVFSKKKEGYNKQEYIVSNTT